MADVVNVQGDEASGVGARLQDKGQAVKSGKREIAIIGLLIWAGGFINTMFMETDPAVITAKGAVLAAAGLAVWGFAGGVFGLDFWMKNK